MIKLNCYNNQTQTNRIDISGKFGIQLQYLLVKAKTQFNLFKGTNKGPH